MTWGFAGRFCENLRDSNKVQSNNSQSCFRILKDMTDSESKTSKRLLKTLGNLDIKAILEKLFWKFEEMLCYSEKHM